MSVLSDIQAERCIPAHQALMGGNAVHTRQDTSTQNFVAVMDEKQGAPLQDDSKGRYVEKMALLIVPLTDVTGNPAELDDQGSFTVDGIVWRVTSIASTAGAWMVDLARRSNKATRTTKK